jgi:hypothetical protein
VEIDFCWLSIGRFLGGGGGGVSAQGKFLDLMWWVFGNSFVRGDRLLESIFNLILMRALRSAFGMTFGVGIELLKRHFLVCLSLPAWRRRPLRIMWSGQMVLYYGISSFLGWSMIGRWKLWPRFIGACILVS